MEYYDLLKRIANEMQLGTLTAPPQRVTGGSVHKTYCIETASGKYAVKLLNPLVIMKPGIFQRYQEAERLEDVLSGNRISIAPAIEMNGRKMHIVDGQYYYLYQWVDGKMLGPEEITRGHCVTAGAILASIHKLGAIDTPDRREEIGIDWDAYIEIADEYCREVADLLRNNRSILEHCREEYNFATRNLPPLKCISNSDFHCRNVIWVDDNPVIIDLESLHYENPLWDVLRSALNWSGYTRRRVDYELLKAFINSYRKVFGDFKADWSVLYGCGFYVLKWIEFNIERVFASDGESREDRELGISCFKNAIQDLHYYISIKEELLQILTTEFGGAASKPQSISGEHTQAGAKKYDITLSERENDPVNIILERIRPGSKVLEFGPASGRMTRVMREVLDCRVWIVEKEKSAYERAVKYAESGICGDIIDYQWLDVYKDQHFDCIIFADVLEHLPNPREVLKKAVSLLNEDGRVFVSVPNIAHNDVLLGLYENRFNYTPAGLLDDSHVYFFAYYNLKPFLHKCGLSPVWEDAVIANTQETEQRSDSGTTSGQMLSLLRKRPLGRVFEFVIEAQRTEYVLRHNIELVSRVREREQLSYVYFYFDFGAGFELNNRLEYAETQSAGEFSYRVRIPKGALKIQFAPGAYAAELFRSVSFTSDFGVLSYYTSGADYNGYDVFFTADPQFFTEVSGLGETWLHISGERVPQDDPEYIAVMDRAAEKTKKQSNQLTIEALSSALEETRTELSGVKEALAEATSERMVLSSALTGAESALTNTRSELAALKDWYSGLASTYDSVVNSRSWRVTRPLRLMTNSFASLLGKGDRQPGQQLGKQGAEAVTGNSNESVGRLDGESCDLWTNGLPRHEKNPLVSVIVPNYNHEQYLRRRLDSVYGQTYRNIEVILLDDASNDDSRTILMEYCSMHPANTKIVFNEQNCGVVAEQWEKGMRLATGKYLWIAESDDYCDPNFLEELIPLLDDQSVMLAFSETRFMRDGDQVWSIEEYLHDLDRFCWSEPFVMTGHMAAQNGFARRNIIPNVSAVLFRNPMEISEELSALWGGVRLVHDWLFYLHMMRGGCIAYTNKTVNFYEVHENSVSLQIQRTPEYYNEQEKVSCFAAENFLIDDSVWGQVLHDLEMHYRETGGRESAFSVEHYYDVNRVLSYASMRKVSVGICVYSLHMGGGEIMPIQLANELRRQGAVVTLIDFNMGEYDPLVRSMLDPSVPLVAMRDLPLLHEMARLFGFDVLHSHHASIDSIVADYILNGKIACKSVVSLHGMYEDMPLEYARLAVGKLAKTCSKYVYLSEKNLSAFRRYNSYSLEKFVRILNGMPAKEAKPVSRETLGIEPEAFVLLSAMRGIPEKGWEEGAHAVVMANLQSKQPIHLVMLGGNEYVTSLKNRSFSRFVHYEGARNNVHDYLAMADMAFLPSRYKGESMPLLLIEALMAGKPALASELGEVREMLADGNGGVAGLLFSLDNWKIPMEELTTLVLTAANNNEAYDDCLRRVSGAARKFSITDTAARHYELYNEVVKGSDRERHEKDAPFDKDYRKFDVIVLSPAGFEPQSDRYCETRFAEDGHRVFCFVGNGGGESRTIAISEDLYVLNMRISADEVTGSDDGNVESVEPITIIERVLKQSAIRDAVVIVGDPEQKSLADYLRRKYGYFIIEDKSLHGTSTGDDNDREGQYRDILEKCVKSAPLASIIVLTYNNLWMSKLCIESIIGRTAYPNYELIIVDNFSTDGTREYLGELEKQGLPNVRVILNTENLGFAGGNNIGIGEASGDYIVLLNNDTIVTRGWLTSLIKHLENDETMGMSGAVTNSIENEARITVDYEALSDMHRFSDQYTWEHMGEIYAEEPEMLAMFAACIRRAVIDKCGLLDEDYTVGMFEDDDYSIRVREAGYRLCIAEDAFVHHFGCAAFKMMEESEYLEIFERNQELFQRKRKTAWKGHKYREGIDA